MCGTEDGDRAESGGVPSDFSETIKQDLLEMALAFIVLLPDCKLCNLDLSWMRFGIYPGTHRKRCAFKINDVTETRCRHFDSGDDDIAGRVIIVTLSHGSPRSDRLNKLILANVDGRPPTDAYNPIQVNGPQIDNHTSLPSRAAKLILYH